MTGTDTLIMFTAYLISISYLLKRVWDYEKISDIILALIIGSIFAAGCFMDSIMLIILSDVIGLSKILYDLSMDSEPDY